MILMRKRGAEQRHNPVAHYIAHRSLVAVNYGHHLLEYRVKELSSFPWISISQQLHRTLDFSEQGRDLLALPFERPLVEEVRTFVDSPDFEAKR
jgi:hypothetical protein